MKILDKLLIEINNMPVTDIITDYNSGILEGIAICRRQIFKLQKELKKEKENNEYKKKTKT